MRPLDPSALEALAAYKRSRTPDERTREANWAAIGNALHAGEIARSSKRKRRGAVTWVTAGVALAAAAGLVAGLSLAPRRVETADAKGSSAAAYTEVSAQAQADATWREDIPARARVSKEAVAPADVPEAESTPEPAAASQDTESEEPEAKLGTRAPTRPRATAKPEAEPAGDIGAKLREEAALVRELRGALGKGESQRAVAIAENYRDRFPSGALAEEVAALELAGLCETGPAKRWRRALERFDARHAGSPLRARVRDDCFDER